MTNEQCIAVAELWGYRHVKDGAGKDWYGEPQPYLIKVWDDGYDEIMMPELQKQVLSWQGFGRTVEVMAERDLVLITHPDIGFCEAGLSAYDGGRVHNIELRELIEATHLAALEAKRKEKEDAEGS